MLDLEHVGLKARANEDVACLLVGSVIAGSVVDREDEFLASAVVRAHAAG